MQVKTALLLYESRSGSTLLAALLNRYAAIAVSTESAYITRILEYPGIWGVGANTRELLDYLFSEVQFVELGLSRTEVATALDAIDAHASPAAAIRALTDAYFARQPTAEVRMIKHPPWNYLRQVEHIWPEVHYVHIVRDVRAVFASKRRTRSLDGEIMERNVVKVARDWRRHVRLAQTATRIHEVRYEDLVAAPDIEIEKILDFLTVGSVGRRQTKTQEEYAASIGDRQQNLHSNVARAPDRVQASRWTEELPATDAAVFEAICAAELDRFGYPRAPSINRPVLFGVIVWQAARLVFDKPRRLWRRTRTGESLRTILSRRFRRWRQRRDGGDVR